MARFYRSRDCRDFVLLPLLLSIAALVAFACHPTHVPRTNASVIAEAAYRAHAQKRCNADAALVARTPSACESLLRAKPGRAEDDIKEDGRVLHVFFRVSAGNSTFSGGTRFMGLSKTDSIVVSALSLGRALGAQPRSARVTVLFDRLQERPQNIVAKWEAGIAKLLLDGAGAAAASRIHISNVQVPAADTGNRGTNLLQFRLARSLSCARAADAAARARAMAHVGGLAAGWARERSADGTLASTANSASERVDSADVVYFVEDDYFHADSALRELLRAAEGEHTAGAGTPPDFLMLSDFPERYYRGTQDVDYGAIGLEAVDHTAWRTTASATMTFAARCAPLAYDLTHFSAHAPYDYGMWLELTTRASVRRRLIAPVRSLAVHGNEDVGGFPVPGDGTLGGRGEVSWCGLVACLRNKAHAVLEEHGLDLSLG